MKKKYPHILGLISALIVLFSHSVVWAITAAVFPVDDLSRQHNSVDLAMTGFLRAEVSRKGIDVVPQSKVMDFMARYNIRQLGYLSSPVIMQARQALGADLVVLASVCEQHKKPVAMGLTISLIRTSDGLTVWSNTRGLNQLAEQHLLGINNPDSLNAVRSILAGRIFKDWPRELDFSAGRAMAGAQLAKIQEKSYIQVESVLFTPKFVRPGQDITCTLRFHYGTAFNRQAKVFIKVGNNVHLASSEDGRFYEAKWVGIDNKPGLGTQVASNESDGRLFKRLAVDKLKDDEFPVTLVLDWPSGRHVESYLGSYVVDSRPPEFTMKLKAVKVGALPAFRDKILFSIKLKKPEPIKKWAMAVVDSKRKVIIRDRGSGDLPDQFVWSGQTNRNLRADEGIYRICFKVWDRAGNSSEMSRNVMLLAVRPMVKMALKKVGDKLHANLRAGDKVPVVGWNLELWAPDNVLLHAFDGRSLPAQIVLPISAATVDKEKIQCILKVRDILGGTSIHKINNLASRLPVRERSARKSNSSTEDVWHIDF